MPDATIRGSSLLTNPAIAAALKQRGMGDSSRLNMPGMGGTASEGSPAPVSPQGGSPTPVPPMDKNSEESKIIIQALTGHLKHLQKISEPSKPPPMPQAAPQGMAQPSFLTGGA